MNSTHNPPKTQLVCGFTNPVFRAGIMDFKHEVSSKECGPSLPLLHWNQSDNLPIARTICYHIKREGFFFSLSLSFPPTPHVPELKDHCFWYREQSLFQECGRNGVFIKVRRETWAWKVTELHLTLCFSRGEYQKQGCWLHTFTYISVYTLNKENTFLNVSLCWWTSFNAAVFCRVA